MFEVPSDMDAKYARGANSSLTLGKINLDMSALGSPESVMASFPTDVPHLMLPSSYAHTCWLKVPNVKHVSVALAALGLCLSLLSVDGFGRVYAILPDQSYTLVATALAGFVAQLVDGALGMGYGLTSSTVLVAAGLKPKTASEVVHLAQLGTTLVSGLAHHRAGTVDWPTTRDVALPGVVGALVGALLLSSLDARAAKTTASALLLVVGAYLLLRFTSRGAAAEEAGEAHVAGSAAAARAARPPRKAVLTPIGVVGGFVDATGGGGWGPVATSGLLAEGRLSPSVVIGTVSMSEFFVTVSAVCGFCLTSFVSGGESGAHAESMRLDLMLSLLTGGLVAAPIAPMLVTTLQPRVLGALVGSFICATNLRVLLAALGAGETARAASYSLVALLGAAAVAHVALSGGKGGDA